MVGRGLDPAFVIWSHKLEFIDEVQNAKRKAQNIGTALRL